MKTAKIRLAQFRYSCRKVEDGVDKPLMVLLDAKIVHGICRNTARIKPEVVQQIYIQSNFTFLLRKI